MELQHRANFYPNDNVEGILDKLGLAYKKVHIRGFGYLARVEINESDEKWETIKELIIEKKAFDLVRTIFTEEEILSSEWVRMKPSFHQGYPQPENSWKTKKYNIVKFLCDKCRKQEQIGSFRVKKEPFFGKKDFLSINWAYPVFITQRVANELVINQINGYEIWEVINHWANKSWEKTCQLYIPTIASLSFLPDENLARLSCDKCKTITYSYHHIGAMSFKRDALPSGIDIVQTHEWFLAGPVGTFREILISNRLAEIILKNKWLGVDLEKVELV